MQTLFIKTPVTVEAHAAVVGKKEGEGPLRDCFDHIATDIFFGENTFEKAESKFVSQAINLTLKKAGLKPDAIDLLFGGDLLNQCIGTSYGIRSFEIPFLGLYGACSTMAESLALASVTLSCGQISRAIAVTSSHYYSAERQYRFPIEYGGQRPPTAQWTVSGSGAVLLKHGGRGVRVTSVTIGKMSDFGITDANNMGPAMAPAFVDTLKTHLKDTHRKVSDYDLILSGDLGSFGMEMARELAQDEGIFLGDNYADCGCLMFDLKRQDVHAGGSGCGCSATVFCGAILPRLESGKYRRVLLISTGALMSPTAIQQGESICGIAHAVCFEGE